MTPIRRLLIANRGEIARRIIRTAQRMGIETVAVHADPDRDALHVREATRAHALGGAASVDSYLRIDKLIAAARDSGADAVHPGYGFLSENPDFAQAVIDAGLIWVGPPPAAIHALGNKARARQLAIARGVPCLPGYQGHDQSVERLQAEAGRIGFPLMVKAAAGGGGRGMRLVIEAAQLPDALRSARSEAESAFGSGELLLERALRAPRHVEVQVFADQHGHCIHLGERDCSVQRRHQKIIEESPSPAVSPELRDAMGRCAVELAQAAGYVGAGTVEFLLEETEAESRFHLMEMNTRLQVEHPVTEAVTGFDLVEWQLRIAQGEPLPCTQDAVEWCGHAIEVRLCAEDDEFRPHAGRVMRFRPPCGAVRFDHAIEDGMPVPPWYDSMLGKLIVHAATRGEAIDALAAALDELCLLGLPNNRALLAACLRHPEFRAGAAHIAFLNEHGDALRAALRDAEVNLLPDAARAALVPTGARVHASPFTRPARVRHRGEVVDVPLQDAAPAAAGLALSRVDGGGWHVQCNGIDVLFTDASFDPPDPSTAAGAGGEIRAPFNGKVIAVRAGAGARVARGDALVVLESMKLEHVLAASCDGVVRAVHVEAGQQAAPFQLLVTLESA